MAAASAAAAGALWWNSGRPNRPAGHGRVGLDQALETRDWRLRVSGLQAAQVEGESAEDVEMALTIEDLRSLPRVELEAALQCREGWRRRARWAGARFADFATKYHLGTHSGGPPDRKRSADLIPYVRLATPDGSYYVGLETQAALDPETLLCYEEDGRPLRLEQGAPLRLLAPHRYGNKSIKRIGSIRFHQERPADYWAERGYDWSAVSG